MPFSGECLRSENNASDAGYLQPRTPEPQAEAAAQLGALIGMPPNRLVEQPHEGVSPGVGGKMAATRQASVGPGLASTRTCLSRACALRSLLGAEGGIRTRTGLTPNGF